MSTKGTTVPAQLYVAYNGLAPDPALLEPVGNGYGQFLLKPSGGLWTAPLVGDDHSAFIDAIKANTNGAYWLGSASTRWRLEPDENLRVLVLDRPDDLRRFLGKKFKSFSFNPRRRPIVKTPVGIAFQRGESSPIDWEQLARDYDCIWARRFVPRGWACESLFWTRFAFTAITQVEVKVAEPTP